MRTTITRIASAVALGSIAFLASSAHGFFIDEQHLKKCRDMLDKGATYLRSTQDKDSGGWGVPPKDTQRPAYPAVTALVLQGLAPRAEKLDAKDPAIAGGVAYILKYAQPDGGIYDKVLPSYNTSIALSALARVDTPEARAAIPKAQQFLRALQWSESSVTTIGGEEASKPVTKDHPFYGGLGYGRHGRPDLSNLQWMLQGFKDSGVAADDAAVQRALVFLQRVQMSETAGGKVINDAPYAKGSRQGGFIYATSESKDKVGSGQSPAGEIEESLDDGTKVSRLRAYGTMTYSGFKSYLYANLKRDDPRVTEAMRWILANYTLDHNPGMKNEGLYYYYVTFSKALGAWGETTLPVVAADGKTTARDWANDLIDQLATLQKSDGSFTSVDARWMENDPTLITAYALIALREAEASAK